MAETNPDPHDALHALASGDPPTSADAAPMNPSDAAGTGESGNGAASMPTGVDPEMAVNPAIDLDARPSSPIRYGTRKARMAQFERGQKGAIGVQFRKTAIPLLLVVGFMLLIMGVFTLILFEADPDTPSNNPLVNHRGLFAGVFFVLALCLLGGGMYFVFEVKKLEAAERRGQPRPPVQQ